MGTPFWSIVIVGMVFTLARFSEAFLVLRAQGVGLSVALVPVVLVVMNVVYSVVAPPAGSLSDRIDRRLVLLAGLAALVLADLVHARSNSVSGVLMGVALWGLHMGLTQGIFAALVADAAPPRLRGTAFGVFNLASGVVLLGASVLAGELWTLKGAEVTFYAGAVFALLAALGLLIVMRKHSGRC